MDLTMICCILRLVLRNGLGRNDRNCVRLVCVGVTIVYRADYISRFFCILSTPGFVWLLRPCTVDAADLINGLGVSAGSAADLFNGLGVSAGSAADLFNGLGVSAGSTADLFNGLGVSPGLTANLFNVLGLPLYFLNLVWLLLVCLIAWVIAGAARGWVWSVLGDSSFWDDMW